MATRRVKRAPATDTTTDAGGATATGRWLLLVHQLAGEPSSLRVRLWRRLQELGALPVKQAVYALPDSPQAREDFTWLKAEIEGVGGEVTIFTADTLDSRETDALIQEFRRTRADAYKALTQEATALLRKASRPRAQMGPTRKASKRIRERLTTVTEVDFFDAPGREAVVSLLRQIDERISPRPKGPLREPPRYQVADYRGRTWLTRPRPGVDRMASAWLIRRFVDDAARFVFATHPDGVAGALPFDMSGVEFSHQGSNCTFETLCALFGLNDAALSQIAALVHDLDLKDNRFGAADAPTIDGLIQGLQLALDDDQRLLEAGMTLFEAQYRSLASGSHGPRGTATRRRS